MSLETEPGVPYGEAAQPPTSDLEIEMGDDHRRGRANNPMREIQARTKRIETRLTQTMIALGIPTQAQTPEFDAAESRLFVPSPHTSLRECTNALPEGWNRPVEVVIGDDVLMVIHRG